MGTNNNSKLPWWIEESIERRNRELLAPKKSKEEPIDESPAAIGGKWIQFVCTDYATRERRTRVLISQDEISEVKQDYELECWCSIFTTNGHQYHVKAPYEEVVEILRQSMQSRRTTNE